MEVNIIFCIFLVINCISNVVSELSNVTNKEWFSNKDLPEIIDGEDCTPGKVYKMDCNTCQCEKDKTLLCTKMGCAKNIEEFHRMFGKKKRGLRSGNANENSLKLPNDEKCEPGKVYVNGCRRCYCTYKKKALCTEKMDNCDNLGHTTHFFTPEDVRPPFTEEETKSLATLPHAAAKCVPGEAYKVDCNTCVCLHNNNLLCTKYMCLSQSEMYQVTARMKSGEPCEIGKKIESNNFCLKCKCVKSVVSCAVDENCANSRRSFKNDFGIKRKVKSKLIGGEKCEPNTIYKDNCNNCYCQEDGTLRCTLKTCLNYRQAQMLKQQRLYLEKHNLL